MNKYRVTNQSDGNDVFEVEAKDVFDAALTALAELGWSLSNAVSEEEEEDVE